MLYKFVYGKQSYYDLAMTRHVEPKTKYDNDDEAEGDDNEKEAEYVGLLAKNEERNGAEVRRSEHSAPRNAPQYKRKNNIGKYHLLPVFVFGKESEDGTGLCITLIFSHMSNIGY